MKKILPFIGILVSVLLPCPDGAAAEPEKPHAGMDRGKLNIGTYVLQPYARTEAHVKDLAECGIDFVVCMQYDIPTLDLFSKYGVGAVVTGILPGWWGGDGVNAGSLQEKNPLGKYEEAAARFQDHPAIWGIDIGDEPSALDFPHYGDVYRKVEELFPNQFPYINLYPNYASTSQNTEDQALSQLGTASYTDHIAEYCRLVPADYICYDFYLYAINVTLAYENLRVVSNAALATGRSMWIVLQVNSLDPEKWIAENELRFQAYTAMAFGVENIIWACYTAGWWDNQVLDKDGNKTEQYDKLKAVNREIHAIAPHYMKYRRTATAFVGFQGTEWLKDVSQESVDSCTCGVFGGIRATDGSPLVVGSMLSRTGNGDEAVFICSADDPYDEHPQTHTVSLKADGRKVVVHTGDGLSEPVLENGCYLIPIASNQGILVEALHE